MSSQIPKLHFLGLTTSAVCHPHHRLSYSHPKDVPADESYLDYQPSYASNEVIINWNVTIFALTAGLDALAVDNE